MSTDLTEIVGDDVNLAPEAQVTTEAPQDQSSTAEETNAPQEPQQPDSRTVPLAALHEERSKRKELAAQIENLRAEQARRDQILEQRLATIAQSREQVKVPTFEENPAAHLWAGQQKLLQSIQKIDEANRAQDQQRQQATIVQHLANVVAQHEAEFSKQAPDYLAATDYLRNQRVAELVADGADEARAAQVAHQELVQFALQRAQQGQDPAAAAYKIATARGYRKAAGQAQQQQPSPEEKLQNQQKGVAASKTLGTGGAAQGKLSLEALASMSDEEFAEATKGNKWAKLFGA